MGTQRRFVIACCQARSRSIRPPERSGLSAGGLMLAVFLAQCAALEAQSTKNPPNPAPNLQSQPAKGGKPIAAAKDDADPKIPPSRFVGEADFDAYIQSLSSMLSIKGRAIDPFGQCQDPDAKPPVPINIVKASRHVEQMKATPFSDIVRLIQVTTIMPREKCFLIGTRSIKQGQTIILTFRGRNIRAEVSNIDSSAINFRNVDNGETASLQLNLLPPGMTPGTRGITAPGMAPEHQNSPIELDPGNASNELQQTQRPADPTSP